SSTGRNRKGGHSCEFGFHFAQLPQKLIELGWPAQLLVLVHLWKHDPARLRKCDDAGGIQTTQARILPAKLEDHALQPILLSLPLAQRMRLQQVIDPARLGGRSTHGIARRARVAERLALERL